ncbi:SPOR domain-containing protein [Ancylomarina sp. DW003]|nr:SPOR domain-containing protein [Ancylomarina sp. DW003]MDE5423208.1 SPOR domain-containing protein [Ancylomarina sp. DW003]
MNTSYKILFITFLSLAVGMSACKEEKKTLKNPKATKKIVKTKAEQKKPAKKLVPKAVVKKAINKYFLISASFKNKNNAERMQVKLEKNGFDSQIIPAPNNFYRVSYKGFSKRAEAFKELKIARNTQGKENVWLHIKH